MRWWVSGSVKVGVGEPWCHFADMQGMGWGHHLRCTDASDAGTATFLSLQFLLLLEKHKGKKCPWCVLLSTPRHKWTWPLISIVDVLYCTVTVCWPSRLLQSVQCLSCNFRTVQSAQGWSDFYLLALSWSHGLSILNTLSLGFSARWYRLIKPFL